MELIADDSRNVLYARSEQGSVQVFDLGADGKSLSKVAVISHQTIVNNATLLAKSVVIEIISLCVYTCPCDSCVCICRGVDRSNLSQRVRKHPLGGSDAVGSADVLHDVRLRTGRVVTLHAQHGAHPPPARFRHVQKPTNVMRALLNKGKESFLR